MKTTLLTLLPLAFLIGCQSPRDQPQSNQESCPATASGKQTCCDSDNPPEDTISDFNKNGISDWKDIADGTSVDLNLNGIPDEAEQ